MNIRQIIPLLLLIVLTILLLVELPAAIAGRSRSYDWFAPVIDTRAILLENYVEAPDEEAMQLAVLKAMVESMDDEYTIYVPPSESAEFQKDLSGHYVGIGAHVRGHEDGLLILSPMDGSPALSAGILANDIVLKVDEFNTSDQPVQDCVDQLLGEPGSTVRLQVRHADGTEEMIEVVRAPITAPTINGLMRRNRQWRYLIDPDLGLAYVRVSQFTMDTVDQLRDALSPLQESGALQGLVLDLRRNPGGALPAAIDMSELFLAEGNIVSIGAARGDDENARKTIGANAGEAFEDVAVVVLIDENSASASEIVAGALADNQRAVVVGERSLGKGSVQEVRPLDGGLGMLKYTTSYYYLPSGRNLHRRKHDPEAAWGVDPSQGCVVAEDPRAMLDRLEHRWTFDAITANEPDVPDQLGSDWFRDEYRDPALAEAVELLRHHASSGTWPKLTEDEDPAFPPLQEELDLAMDRRAALERHLIELDDQIFRLQGVAQTIERGLIGLEDDVSLDNIELMLRRPDGEVIGLWRIGQDENIRATLDAVKLEPVEETPDESG